MITDDDSKQGARDDQVKRFIIAEAEGGYSEFWRRDKSPIESLELAKFLLGLRKVTSFIGRNVGDLVWSGMDVVNGIAIDPTPVMGKYPVPAATADLMIGIAIQEAFRKTEWSERIKILGKERLQLPPQYEYKFDLFFDVCEKVYFDCLANKKIFGIYTEIARQWKIKNVFRELITPPTLSELLHIWWKLAADRDGTKYKDDYIDRSVGGLVERGSLEKFYKKPITILNTMVEPLRHECPGISGVSERGDFRLNLYLGVWSELLKYIKFWPGDRGDRFILSGIFDDDIARDEKDKDAVKATITSYAELIEKAISQKNVDFTDQVRDNVMNVDAVVQIEGNDIVMIADNKIDRKLLQKLKMEIQAISHRKTTYNRGLKTGKIHRRKLYRAHTNGAVFQIRKNEYELLNDIVLLVDATGSMADPSKWEKTERIYQTLFAALHSYNRNARIIAYNEVKNTCRITELYRDGILFTVLPHGKTASGEAIIATAISLKNTTRKYRIVHITDGASNWGCGVSEAITYCRKNNVGLMTLGIGCSAANKQSLRDEYGKLVQFVDNLDQLPRLFGSMLHYDRRVVN